MAESCIHCNSHLPSKGFYCPNCATQVRCKSCSEALELQAAACIYCGASVSSTPSNPNLNPNGATLNSIEYSETKFTKSFKASFTDSVGTSVSEAFGHVLAKGLLTNHQSQPKFQKNEEKADDEFSPIEVVSDDFNTVTALPEHFSSAGLEKNSELSKILRIFKFEDGKAALIEVRLKANTKYNFLERLIILFLYAHKVNGKNRVQRSEVTNILNETGLNDGNARQWISKSDRYMRKISDTNELELIIPGEEKAKEYLLEILDTSIENKWSISAQTKQKRRNKIVKSDE